jgi:hypothetical protein
MPIPKQKRRKRHTNQRASGDRDMPVAGFQSRMPRRVPELSPGTARRGAAWMQRVASGPGMALLATPGESEERRTNRQDSRFACIAPVGRGIGMCRVIQAAIGSPFLWLLSFRLHGQEMIQSFLCIDLHGGRKCRKIAGSNRGPHSLWVMQEVRLNGWRR